MKMRRFQRLRVVLAAAAVLLVATSTSQATLTLSMPQVSVLPGATTATAIVRVTSDVASQQVVSINPALSVSTMMGSGTATFSGPNGVGIDIYTAVTTVPGTLWTAQTSAGITGSPAPTPLVRKYNISTTGGTFVTVPAGGASVIQLSFALAGVLGGDVFQINLNADVDGDGSGDTTASQPSAGVPNVIPLNIVGGVGKIVAVPEPSAFALMGLVGGVAAIGTWYRKRRAAQATAA